VDSGKRGKGTKKLSVVERLRKRYRWLDHLVRAATRYNEHHGDHYAGAITYFSVLALFPLLMIAFSLLGFVLYNQPELIAQVKDNITRTAPAGLGDAIGPVVDRAVDQRTAVGIIGLLGAAYAGLGWMGNLREALTALWDKPHEKASFVKVKLADGVALIGLGLAVLLSLALSAVGGFAGNVMEWFGLGDVGLAWVVVKAVSILLALAGNWLVFVWAIAKLPREPVTLRSAAKAAVIGAIGFEILKQGATFYLSRLSGPAGAIFGPVIGLLVFVFLVSRFLLFITAWAATAEENEERAAEPEPRQPVVIRPAVTVHSGPDGRTATGLLGAGAILGAGLAWLLRRR
jgi:membrane protein